MRQIFSRLPLLVTLALVTGTSVIPQEASPQEQARQLLHDASLLIKDIPEGQQSSAAANIAGQLARPRDLPGALDVVRSLKNAGDRALSLGNLAWWMDHKGNSAGALDLLESPDVGQNRAPAYQQLALLTLTEEILKAQYR